LTKNSYAIFVDAVWEKLRVQPLGSLTKRELELVLLRAAADADLLELRAENLATTCHIPISRAHGYLTDLALREAPLSDPDAVKALVGLLKDSEVVCDDAHFSIPLHDASLRIWLERKMALLRLNSGDSLRVVIMSYSQKTDSAIQQRFWERSVVISKNKLSDPETVLGMIRPIQMDRV
jgi:hypothetical protein